MWWRPWLLCGSCALLLCPRRPSQSPETGKSWHFVILTMPRFAPSPVSGLRELSEAPKVFAGMLIPGDWPCLASSMDIEVGIRAHEPYSMSPIGTAKRTWDICLSLFAVFDQSTCLKNNLNENTSILHFAYSACLLL